MSPLADLRFAFHGAATDTHLAVVEAQGRCVQCGTLVGRTTKLGLNCRHLPTEEIVQIIMDKMWNEHSEHCVAAKVIPYNDETMAKLGMIPEEEIKHLKRLFPNVPEIELPKFAHETYKKMEAAALNPVEILQTPEKAVQA